jgi:hypothetical protein
MKSFAGWGLALAAVLTLSAQPVMAEMDDSLVVAVGEPGSDSFIFGTELWAMTQISLLPTHGFRIEAQEASSDEGRLALMRDRNAQAALITGPVPAALDDDMRTIMALWPSGAVAVEVRPAQLLVRRDVSEESIYLLTKAMFEHAGFMKSARSSLGIGSPSEAMMGLDWPLHAGAVRYYREIGFGPEAEIAANQWSSGETQSAESQGAGTSVTYRNFDDSELGSDEIGQIVGACRSALDVGSLSPLLGDLSHTGCEVYTKQFLSGVEQQDQALKSASVSQNGDGQTEADEAPVGQGGPAILWRPPSGSTKQSDSHASENLPFKMQTARQPVM